MEERLRPTFSPDPPKDKKRFSTILCVYAISGLSVLALHMWFALMFDVTADEAYYWVWSRNLQMSYLDHPPLVAYLIAAGEWITSSRVWGVRLFPLLTKAALVFGVWKVAYRWRWRGLTCALALVLTPMATLGGVLMTPDIPLVCGAFLVFWAMLRFLEGASYRKLLCVGVVISILSKYLGLWVVLWALCVCVWGKPKNTVHVRERWVSIALVLLSAGVSFLPVLYWNAEHGWASLAYQVGWRLTQENSFHVLDFIMGILGTTGVIPVVLWFYRRDVFCRNRDYQKRMWTAVYILAPVTLLFFMSCFQVVNPNWFVIVYPGVVYLMVAVLESLDKGSLSWGVKLGVGAHMGFCCLIILHAINPLSFVPLSKDRLSEVNGVSRISTVTTSLMKDVSVLRTESYQQASLIHFYTSQPPVYTRIQQLSPDSAPVRPTAYAYFTPRSENKGGYELNVYGGSVPDTVNINAQWHHRYRNSTLSTLYFEKVCAVVP